MKIEENSFVDIIKNNKFKNNQYNKSFENVNEILSRDFTVYHIEELTFEDKSPRKEALENVISAINLDGINFVYLLVGDKNGVSFYFGIVKDKHNTQDLDLDIDDIGSYILKPSIEGNFRGSKVTNIKSKKTELLEKISNMNRFAKISGVPSVNEDNENFQGVDRVVDIMMGDEFALMVLADPLSKEELNNIENSLYDIHNRLSPLTKESVQESSGESNTKGSSLSKNNSETTGENSGISISTTEGETIEKNNSSSKSTENTTSKSTSKSTNESTNRSKSTSQTGTEDTRQSQTESSTKGTRESKNKNISRTENKGENNSKTVGSSESTNNSTSTNKGLSKTREFTQKRVMQWINYIDDTLLPRLEYGQNKGIFNVSIYMCAKEKGILTKLGSVIKAIFSGIDENKAPLEVEYITDKKHINSIKNMQIPKCKNIYSDSIQKLNILHSKSNEKNANWMSVNELSVIVSLPQKEVVGLSLKEEVEFGLNIKKQIDDDKNSLLLGNLVQSGKVLDIEVKINKDHLNKHTFITGVTGSGKTTTCQRVLDSANMPFMVIEPAKTEYRVLTKKYKDILIFTLGNEKIAPFRLNPFEFFEGENISSRVDMIKANIESAFDMEAAIPQIIESALYECYKDYGWDIATSTNTKFKNPYADGVYAFPTLSDLIIQVEKVSESQGFDERLKNDYIGSIKARLQGLMVGAKGFMLNTPRSIDFRDLVEKNIILELEEIKNGAEKSLIMGFVLINLNEAIKLKYKEYKDKNKEFKHITLIEEAHRLLSKYTPGDSPSKKLGVETFTDMLAEVRKYGESLIIVDQIPNKLTPEVLKNTNTKIVHKLFASDDKEAIGNTMSLSDEQKEFLSNLDTGRAIVSNQDFAKPLQVQIRQLEDISTTQSKIVKESEVRDLALKYYANNYKKGIVAGLNYLKDKPTINEVEEFLNGNIYQFLEKWEEYFKSENAPKEIPPYLLELYSKCNSIQNVIADILYNKFYKQADYETQINLLNNILNKMKQKNCELNRQEIAYIKIK